MGVRKRSPWGRLTTSSLKQNETLNKFKTNMRTNLPWATSRRCGLRLMTLVNELMPQQMEEIKASRVNSICYQLLTDSAGEYWPLEVHQWSGSNLILLYNVVVSIQQRLKHKLLFLRRHCHMINRFYQVHRWIKYREWKTKHRQRFSLQLDSHN